MKIELESIGFVRTEAEKVPRSWRVSDVEAFLEIGEAYEEGLRDIEPGQRIVVIFHESPTFPPRFSICSPVRPGRNFR